jgi:hypothetical protein
MIALLLSSLTEYRVSAEIPPSWRISSFALSAFQSREKLVEE